MRRKLLRARVLLPLAAALLLGCENPPQSDNAKQAMSSDAQAALMRMEARDDGLQALLNDSYGYAILPSVGKGGFIVGAAHGGGEVYRQGMLIGYTALTQGSVGAQAGGQEFSELIVFKDQWSLDRFIAGNYSFDANASAVALKAGAAAAASYKDGVAVFTLPTGGLMFEASIGGQKFSYQPIEGGSTTRPSSDYDGSNPDIDRG